MINWSLKYTDFKNIKEVVFVVKLWKTTFFISKIEILLRILNSLLINKPLVFNLYYNIDFACIGVDSITEVLVEPIFFIVSIIKESMVKEVRRCV